jgi:hypothetical protein
MSLLLNKSKICAKLGKGRRKAVYQRLLIYRFKNQFVFLIYSGLDPGKYYMLNTLDWGLMDYTQIGGWFFTFKRSVNDYNK